MSETWTRLQPGMQLGTFGHAVNYGGYQITDQQELDCLLMLHEMLAEEGVGDNEINDACLSFLRRRRMN